MVPEPLTPELVLVVAVGVAGGFLVDQESGDALVLQRRVDGGEDQGDIGVRAVGDEDLVAIEHVIVAVALGGGAQGGGVGAGAGLGEPEAAEPLAGGEGLQEALLLIVVAEELDRVANQRIVHRQDHAGRSANPADLLDDDGVRHHVHAGATPFLGHRDAGQAHLGRLGDHLDGEDPLGIDVLGHRRDHLFGESSDLFAQQLLFFAELDLHGISPEGPGGRVRVLGKGPLKSGSEARRGLFEASTGFTARDRSVDPIR